MGAMDYRVEVFWRGNELSGACDGRAVDLLSQLAHLGLPGVERVRVAVSNLYFLRGELTPAEVERVACELLVDPVVEGYRYTPIGLTAEHAPAAETMEGAAVEVGYRPGVTDATAEHLMRRARLLCQGKVEAAATGMRYVFSGVPLSADELHRIARELLCNDVIQTYALGQLQPAFVPYAEPTGLTEVIPLREADDETLLRISTERVLSLTLTEMKAIQAEFRRLGRDPTDVELETLAQTWSEHCQHKTFKGRILFRNADGREEIIDGLLRTTIRAATEKLARPWVRSAFTDNAGIIDFDEEFEVSFKVETHNHPSALEPFGGANTGIGGVIRDIIGVSARPIANTDVLCFGPLDFSAELPTGILHPRRIARGVVAGIEDYGNKMGIPTVSGAVLYDPGYIANPLVFCGCVGLAPKGVHPRAAQPGDLCVAIGGRTGRDGIHGATFSSAELTHQTGETVGSVVQIGDPIVEKAVLEAVLRARDERLYHAITDCGAGGFSSAVGEMGREIGVEVELSHVPLKYPGLRPWEIWLSEAQERMVLAVPEESLPRLREICEGLDVELTVIGRFTGDRRLRVCYEGCIVADMEMQFVHEGWPRPLMRAAWEPSPVSEEEPTPSSDLSELLLRMLAHPDVASKETIIRRYDHEVQGATVVRPLVGPQRDGPSDAAVLRPLETRGPRGLALGCGINPHYGRSDPYAMAWAVVDEAVRNVVSVGADPERIALLDNFCWGNPALPDRLGALVRAAQGCHDAALAYGTPFISGKDSLNNEYVDPSGAKRAIPPTLLISALGIVPDVERVVTMDLKAAGDLIYIVGETRPELGRSLYARLCGGIGRHVPAPVPDAIETLRAVHQAIQAGIVRACHDLSEGGLAVAAAEMALAGRLGLDLELCQMPLVALSEQQDWADIYALFAETSCRFLVEIQPTDRVAFERLLAGRPFACLGQVVATPVLRIRGLNGEQLIECSVSQLLQAWQGTEVV